MFSKFQKIKILISAVISISAVYFGSAIAYTNNSGFDIDLYVEGCNNNSICEPVTGENNLNCPNDCPCNNNGICEIGLGEDNSNCSSDCPCNNNGICEIGNGENVNNCPSDCIDSTTNTGSSGTSGGSVSLVITDLQVIVETDSVKIYWKTNLPAKSKILWGESVNYEKGSLSETTFIKDHYVKISNLEPSKKYFFSITAVDKNNRETFYQNFFVSSREFPDIFPENISNLKYQKIFDGIRFNWSNPQVIDFSSVRVVRLENRFARSPFEGEIVYEGGGNSFIDYDFIENKQYYYSFFVRTTSGDYSSGVFIRIDPDESTSDDPLDADTGIEIDKTIINGINLSIWDFNFNQDSQGISFTESNIPIRPNIPTEIIFPAQLIPLDSIAVLNVLQPRGEIKEINLLFRLNQERNYYVGKLPPFVFPGDYPFTIQVYDRNYRLISLLEGKFVVSGAQIVNMGPSATFLALLIIFFVLSIIILLIRTQKKIKNILKNKS